MDDNNRRAENNSIPSDRDGTNEPVELIKNPLPGPKPHVPKTMDYDLVTEGNADFDIEVAEDADFDV